jgi:hypothetical protein
MESQMSAEQERQENELDPIVRAVAEARARDAGQSVSDYLADLLLVPHGPSALQLLTGSGLLPERPIGGERWSSSFSRHLIATARDMRSRYDADQWSQLVAGSTPWLVSEVSVSPALKLVFVFNYRVQSAALLMSAAFQEAAVADFDFVQTRSTPTHRLTAKSTWYHSIVDHILDRSKQLRNALVHNWTPTPRAERLAIDAFVLLSDLTPARTELLRLCRYDRPRAFSELAKHIGLAADQFRLSADLLAEVEGASRQWELPTEERFSEISNALLQKAGGGVSLTEGAKLLRTSRQALHKRVKLGTALGLMRGSELTLPRCQFVGGSDSPKIVDGLGSVVKLFDTAKAGRWSALQFLIEKDPNLGDMPIHTLTQGRVQDAVNAAKAYLDADEA